METTDHRAKRSAVHRLPELARNHNEDIEIPPILAMKRTTEGRRLSRASAYSFHRKVRQDPMKPELGRLPGYHAAGEAKFTTQFFGTLSLPSRPNELFEIRGAHRSAHRCDMQALRHIAAIVSATFHT
eukprot:6179424-Pleurochrysis_carterae.AAC.2